MMNSSRIYYDENIDVRLFIFTGKKLIFCSRDPKKFYDEWIKRLKNDIVIESWFIDKVFNLNDGKVIILLPLVPISVSVSASINNFRTAKVVFANVNRRFMKRLVGEDIKLNWDSWKEYSLLDEKELEEAKKLLKKCLGEMEDNEYYEKLLHYVKNEKVAGLDCNKYSRPFRVIDCGYLISIEAKDRDGEWRSIFYGYVSSITESYTSATDWRIDLTCLGFASFFDRIPIFPELGSGLFLEWILPYDNEELKHFYTVYYAQYRKTGDYWKSTYIGKTLKELMSMLSNILRIRMGMVSKEEMKKNLKEAGIKDLTDEVIDKAIRVYEKYLLWDYAYIFPFYKVKGARAGENKFDTEVNIYEGHSNKREKFYLQKDGLAGIYIPAEFCFKGEGGLELYEKIYGSEVLNKLKKVLNFDEIFEAFQKLIGLSISQARFHPTEKKLSEVFKSFIKVFSLIFFEDGLGNLIIDFPRVNELPTSEFAFYEDLRKKEGERYILWEHKDILNSTIIKDSGRLLTALYVHSKLNIPNFTSQIDILNEELTSGHAWHTPYHLLKFGYNVEVLQDIYFNFQLKMEDLDEFKKVFNQYASSILELRNAFATKKFKVTLRHRPDIELARTAYVPSQEKLYFINSITHSITPGSDFTTTIDLSAGHDIDLKLKEPRYFLMKFSDTFKKATATDGLVEGVYTASCNIVRINREYFPADIKKDVMTICPYPSVRVEEIPITEYNKDLPEFIEIFEDKQTKYIDIDIRLLKFIDWFFVTFTNFFNDKEVLKYDNLVFIDEPDVLVFPKISDIWRIKEPDKKSRHFEGRAIDISGLTFLVLTYRGLLKVLSKLLQMGGISKIVTTNNSLDYLKIRSKVGDVFVKTYSVQDVTEVKIVDFTETLNNWKYEIEVEGEKKVVMMRLDIFKEWWDEYCKKSVKLLGSSKSVDNLMNLAYLLNKYVGKENVKWITRFSPDMKVQLDAMNEILKAEGSLTDEERNKVFLVQYKDFLKGASIDEYKKENLELLSKFVIKDGVLVDIICDSAVKEWLEPTKGKKKEEDYKRILVALAPENYILKLDFHFNGLPDKAELVSFVNRVSDLVTASILYYKNQQYFMNSGIGYFFDASGGVRKCLMENKHLYTDVSVEIKEIVNEVAGDIEGTNGWEKHAKYNYVIWKGGKNKSYDEIKKERITIEGNMDYYHLYHIHVSVGIPDCEKIEVLRRTYGI